MDSRYKPVIFYFSTQMELAGGLGIKGVATLVEKSFKKNELFPDNVVRVYER